MKGYLAEARGVAIIVGNHDGGIERLEVQHQHGAGVQPRHGLQDQGQALGGPLLLHLLAAG